MKRYKLLLVEDDELDIISVERSLKKIDVPYELLTAYNGEEALNILMNSKEEELPDVILLDLNMPKMNGIEFLRVLRKDNRLMHTRVFIMTTSAESVDRSTTEELGISGYIIKPLNYTDNTKRTGSMEAFVEFHLRKIMSGNE